MATSRSGRVTRREWAAGALAAGLAAGAGQGDLSREIEDLKAVLKKAGIGPLRLFISEHYLAIGNGTERFLRDELNECERMAWAYLGHYRARGFEVKAPEYRMTIVVLATAGDFRAYLSAEGAPNTGGAAGVYDRKSNRLIVFLGVAPADDRGRLSHEATHQLTFNTGLLAREGDVPRCFIEGLGCYGECVKPGAMPLPGQMHFVYLGALRRKSTWIPIAQLIWSDHFLLPDAGTDLLLAYAESWMLVHFLMNDPAHLPGFRRYLSAVRGRRDATRRLDDAREHLGDLEQLHVAVKHYGDRMVRDG